MPEGVLVGRVPGADKVVITFMSPDGDSFFSKEFTLVECLDLCILVVHEMNEVGEAHAR